MRKKMNVIFAVCCLVFITGCAQITETVKVIWGSSTRALENARVDAISKTYRCGFNDCYDAVLSLARRREARDDRADRDPDVKPVNENHFDVFINNRKKRHIVVMGIKGNVDTTEVGIFFSQPSLTTVKLEVTSLSSSAKRKVAQMIFDKLDLRFSESH